MDTNPVNATPATALTDIQMGDIGKSTVPLLVVGNRIPNKYLQEFVKEYLRSSNNNYQEVLEQLLLLDELAENGNLP